MDHFKSVVESKIKSRSKSGTWTFHRNSEQFLEQVYDMLCVIDTGLHIESPEMEMTISSSIDMTPITCKDFKVRYVKETGRMILVSKKCGYMMILNPHQYIQNDGISSLKLVVKT